MPNLPHIFIPTCICSGADLKAILAEAQLLAVHSALNQANHLDAPAPSTSLVSHSLGASASPSASFLPEEHLRESHAQVANSSCRNDLAEDEQQAEAPLMLTMAHVRQALANVRPSVHAGQNRQQQQQQHSDTRETSKRATLA
eukprot:1151045-Pelagomonas_calceolata.AAC.8